MNIIRASELGSCLKAQVAKQLGFTPMDAPEKIQAAYERGNLHEEQNAEAMGVEMYDITRQQEEVVLDVLDNWQIVGHLDGIVSHEFVTGAKQMVWEAKAPNAWEKFATAHRTGDWSDPLAHRYAWQISAYMLATGLEAYVTSWDEERGVRGFGIEVPPFTLEQVKDRVWLIAQQVTRGELMPTCSQADWPCPYYYLHEDTEPVTEDDVLDEMIIMYYVWLDEERKSAEKKKKLQERIRAHLEGENITTTKSKVTFYTQQGAERWDDEKVRKILTKHGYHESDYRVRDKGSDRMKITRRGDG